MKLRRSRSLRSVDSEGDSVATIGSGSGRNRSVSDPKAHMLIHGSYVPSSDMDPPLESPRKK